MFPSILSQRAATMKDERHRPGGGVTLKKNRDVAACVKGIFFTKYRPRVSSAFYDAQWTEGRNSCLVFASFLTLLCDCLIVC